MKHLLQLITLCFLCFFSNIQRSQAQCTPPTVANGPRDSFACEFRGASFDVQSLDTGLTYQWQVNTGSGFNNVPSNGNNSIYQTPNLNMAYHLFEYRCIITNACGSDTSDFAVLHISEFPYITLNPDNVSVCAGANVVLGAGAAGTTNTYFWEVDNGTGWAMIPGSNNDSLFLYNVPDSLNGYRYRMQVIGYCNRDTTEEITLLVNHSIISHPSDEMRCPNQNAYFNVQILGTVTYQWQVNLGSGWNDVSSNGNNSTYGTPNLSLADDQNQYRCIVTSSCGNDTSDAAILSVLGAPVITTEPVSQSVCVGSNVFLGSSVTGMGNGSYYIWQKQSGANWFDQNVNNDSLFYYNAYSGLTGVYRMIAVGACGSDTSVQVTLIVNGGQFVSDPRDTTICPGQNTRFSVSIVGTVSSYLWQVNSGAGWSDLPSSNVANLDLISLQSSDSGSIYRCIITTACGNDTSNPATLHVARYVSISGPVPVTVCSGSSTYLSAVVNGNVSGLQWQSLEWNGWQNINGQTSDTLHLNNISYYDNGNNYRIVATGRCNTVHSDTTVLTVIETPLAVYITPDTSLCEGNTATIHSFSQGSNLVHQWQVNTGTGWVDINNSDVQHLIMPNVSASYSGNRYRVIISNSCGSDTSDATTLTVYPNSNLPQTNSVVSVCLGSNAHFGFASYNNMSYTWQILTDSGWVNMNASSNDSLYLSNVQLNQDSSYYRVIANGNCNTDTSGWIMLQVNRLPSINISSSQNPIYIGIRSMECATLTANTLIRGTYTYSWNSQDTTSQITTCPTRDSVYSVTVTDANGCSSTTTFNQIVRDIRSPYTGRVYICYRYPRRLVGTTLNIPVAQVQQYLNAGATLGACATLPKRNDIDNFLSIEELYKVYPNPTSSVLNVEWFNIFNEKVEIVLTDLNGKIVKQVYNGLVYEGNLDKVEISTQDLDAGMYILRFSSDSDIRNHKLQIVR